MASPQKERGHTPIANELLEKIFSCPGIKLYDLITMLWVARNTYGWSRKMTIFSWHCMAKDANRDRGGFRRSVLALLKRKILYQDGKKIGINKDYEAWLDGGGRGTTVPWDSHPRGTAIHGGRTSTKGGMTIHKGGDDGPQTSYAREKQVKTRKQGGASARTTAPPANGGLPHIANDRYCPKCHVGHHHTNPCIIWPGAKK